MRVCGSTVDVPFTGSVKLPVIVRESSINCLDTVSTMNHVSLILMESLPIGCVAGRVLYNSYICASVGLIKVDI
jgi:hypothetical protein